MGLKNVWTTEHGRSLCTLTLESDNAKDENRRIDCRELLFPQNPSAEHPLRHTLCLGLFSQDDINLLAQQLDLMRTDKP